jgi:NAD(P)-dependent dehydrogenase (short-subunit alcohol dehydrogenase family)
MNFQFDFSNRHILITGAAGGIGAGLCCAFLDWGATVSGFDNDQSGLESLAIGLANPSKLTTEVVDLTDLLATLAATKKIESKVGPVNVLINNVGAASATALANLTAEGWKQDMAINLSSAYHCVEAVKRGMLERHEGVIVNIGSVNGLLALGHPAYSAAKAGLVSYTKSLAIEYGPHGLRVNIICPGTVKTQAWSKRVEKNPQIFENLKKWYPLRDFADPSDIAAAAAFLASDAARSITGVVLPVDGGLTAGNPVMAAELTLEEF